MNILNCYATPDVRHGTERSMQLKSLALKARGNRLFLAHGMSTAPRVAGEYEAVLSVPPLFDGGKLPPRGLKAAEQAVAEFIARERIDVIHIHGGVRTGTLRRMARRFPLVVSVHVPLCPNGSRYLWKSRCVCNRKVGIGCFTTGYLREGCGRLGNGEPWGVPGFARSMVQVHAMIRALKRCARVVANSEWMATQLEADGVPAGTIRVVCPPIEEPPSKASAALIESPPAITFVGRLVDFKGPDHLLLASSKIKTPHQVWFVGDGPMREQLEKMSRELGIADHVKFIGSKHPAEVDRLRVRSSIIAVPSLWPEPFGRVGPEALTMERPVVGYRVGGIPEWLADGKVGVLVEPGDVDGLAAGIERLLADPDLARAMGAAGPAHAARWSANQHAASLEQVFAEAVAHFRGHEIENSDLTVGEPLVAR